MCWLDNAGKRKGSDSDSYDEDDGVEGSYQIIGSVQDDTVEKDLIAASKVTTQVGLPVNSWISAFFLPRDAL